LEINIGRTYERTGEEKEALQKDFDESHHHAKT
jgi:hypothetical protein